MKQNKQIEKKIKGMFDAVFEPREEFMSLPKSSQDLLLGQLMDDIVDGFEALEKDLKSIQSQTKKELVEKTLNLIDEDLKKFSSERPEVYGRMALVGLRTKIQSISTESEEKV